MTTGIPPPSSQKLRIKMAIHPFQMSRLFVSSRAFLPTKVLRIFIHTFFFRVSWTSFFVLYPSPKEKFFKVVFLFDFKGKWKRICSHVWVLSLHDQVDYDDFHFSKFGSCMPKTICYDEKMAWKSLTCNDCKQKLGSQTKFCFLFFHMIKRYFWTVFNRQV